MGELKDLFIKAMKKDDHDTVCGFIRYCKLTKETCFDDCILGRQDSLKKLTAELEEGS